MSDDILRSRLQGIGTARLAAIGLGAPSTTAPATPEPTSIRVKYAEHQAARKPSAVEQAAVAAARAAQPAIAAEQSARDLACYQAYRDAPNAMVRAVLRSRDDSGAIERGRAIEDSVTPDPEAA